MGLVLGQYGFIVWWSVTLPGRIIDVGKSASGAVSDTFAVKAMLTHLSESIFQDPTWQGRLIGIGIRIMRILIGLFGQFLVLVATGVALILWYLFPLIAIYGVLR